MKVFFLLLTLLLIVPAQAFHTPAGWETDLAAARKKAARSNKPLLILISGPDWSDSSKKLHQKVVNDYFFNMTARKYAVCLFIHQPPKSSVISNSVLKNIDALKKVLPGNGVPRYAIVDANLNLLAKPRTRSLTGFMGAISTASKKINGTAVKEFSELAAYERKKEYNRKQREKKRELIQYKSCSSTPKTSSGCSSYRSTGCSGSRSTSCRIIRTPCSQKNR